MNGSILRGMIGLGILFGLAGGTFAQNSQSDDGAVKAMLQDRVEKAKHGTCIVVGIVEEKGSRVVSFGTLNGPGSPQAGGDSVFEIGSASKAFTGVLLADAVERKQVTLDEPVGKLLPAGTKVPSRNGRQITMADLSTHTSALPRLPDNMVPKDPANPYTDYTPAQLYQFLSRYALPRDIGAQYEYSNLGAGLLGFALARQAGGDYEGLLVKRICEPLGMKETRLAMTAAMKARLAKGHYVDGRPAPNWDLGTLAGAGGIRSTVNDMMKFVAANMSPPKTELGRAMELAQTPRHEAGSPNVQIGLGWHITTSPGGTVVWHNGETGGYHSFVGFDRKKKMGVVVLSNSAGSIDDIGIHLLDPSKPLIQSTKQRVAVKLAPDVLDRYVGKYELAPGVFFNIKRDAERLLAQLTGQGLNEVLPESETQFFYKVVDAQLTFVKDSSGKVTSLVLHQNGVDQTAKRVSSVVPAERKVAKVDPKIYDEYAGEYQLAPGAVFTVKREGEKLTVQLTGQPAFEVFPESEKDFFYKVVDAQISFVKDGAGKVTRLVLHQNGVDQEAKRVR